MISFVQPEARGSSGMKGYTFNNRITKYFLSLRLAFEIIKGLHRKEDRVHAK
jgi:hypothetical protein